MLDSSGFREAVQIRSMTRLTKAISEAAEALAYQLKPPYTEILTFRAKEENDRFHVHFAARLHLHYASLKAEGEGLVFKIQFAGEALSDTPNPPIDELFYAAVVRSLEISSYGARCTGESTKVNKEVMDNLELPSDDLTIVTFEDFCKMLDEKT